MAYALITNGGKHLPESWARATVNVLVNFGPNVTGERLLAADEMKTRMARALVSHHRAVQEKEEAALQEHGVARYAHDTSDEAMQEAEKAYDDMIACAAGTEWEKDFADPTKRQQGVWTIASHFQTDRDVHRQWHADRNPSPEGRAFKASRHGVDA